MREKAILFCGTLFHSIDVYNACLSVLQKTFGTILLASPPLLWNFSEYYQDELGTPLSRNFIFFDPIIDSAVLPEAKLKTMEIEGAFSENGKRRINLDPGYLSLAKVVLASRKNYSHRINLGKAVFAELELIYKDGVFHPLPYSYRDYRDSRFVDRFTEARSLLKKTLTGGLDSRQ